MRLKIIFALFVVGYLSLIFRLFSWQVISGSQLAQQARGQYQSTRTVSASRGSILASDGSALAARGESWLIFASLPEIKESAKSIANSLAPIFVNDTSDRKKLLEEVARIEDLLERREVVWVPIKHRLGLEEKDKIEFLGITGIGFEPEETRIYPEASLSAHLLGFVGKDHSGQDVGYFGLEGNYDPILKGKSGFVGSEKDASGIPILLGSNHEVEATSGVDLLTHIDKTVQYILETKLKDGIEKYGAKEGTVVLMNPENGAVLGMASFPSYDPANYWEEGNEYFKNPAVSDTFEPGSIFKVLVMAAALDTKVVEPGTICEICSGPLKVDKYTIETWDKKYHPDSTMTEVIVNSDNVGMAYVGQKLGADKLYDYLNNFGIGKLSGIDLQGEATPPLREKGTWNIVDLATASFGQGVAVTPIQMVRGVSAIANGGYLVTPQVVDKLIKDGWEEDIKPQKGEKVISKETADLITQMMVEAAKRGESKWTNLRGFKVAGKTGTAQVPIAGHYDEEKTIGSFVGFAPADKPKFVMLVTLREPSSSPWASETAAPLWYSIARELFTYFGIQPEN